MSYHCGSPTCPICNSKEKISSVICNKIAEEIGVSESLITDIGTVVNALKNFRFEKPQQKLSINFLRIKRLKKPEKEKEQEEEKEQKEEENELNTRLMKLIFPEVEKQPGATEDCRKSKTEKKYQKTKVQNY